MKYSYSSAKCTILQDGRIKPGIYKIRNVVSKTYVDIKDDVRELCGRPSTALEDSRGQSKSWFTVGAPNHPQWEILPLGSGYSIRKAGGAVLGKPDQFCIMLDGMGNENAVSVSEFPVAWKIVVVDDARYSGFEYVRIFWGSTNKVWDLAQWGSGRDGTKIQVMENSKFEACRVWELLPVKVDNFASQPSPSQFQPNAAPPYEEREKDCSTCSHVTTEPCDNGYGTTVIEVTTVTTRTKYRVED